MRHLANAIEALEAAYENSVDGFTADSISNAERECYKAVDQLVRSQVVLDDKPFPLSEPESTISGENRRRGVKTE